MDYITITTLGNATTFGNMSALGYHGSCSNGTRGIVGGGDASGVNIIEYFTFAIIGNTIDFGDLTLGRWELLHAQVVLEEYLLVDIVLMLWII